MKIIITSPSLDEKVNVSGISTLVRQIIERSSLQYIHFLAGKKDNERRGIFWIFRQILLPIKFYRLVKDSQAHLIHINTALNPLSILRDFSLCLIAKRLQKPVILHIHGGKFLTQEFEKLWLKRITKKMMTDASAILVLSETEQKIIKERFGKDALVLKNAVSVEEFSVGKKQKNSIVFLGRMHESKGLFEIIEAFHEIKELDFCFTAFGNGEMKEFFIEKMKALLGSKFRFGGVIAGRQKTQILSQADILILPSRYGEGLPIAILEAMAAGCLVIASDIASVGSVIRNGINGFLIKPKDAKQLAEKLKLVLRMDESHKTSIRKKARKTIESHFDLKNYIQSLEQIYRKIAK
ncbi:MAG: glycosyltransferase family 4 protein [Pyrinomonadaceae bacterium]|nr:glycosyltransferase family 4 protein [Pyrinomonadaceae bacterium]MCX7640818.1 glycosyltransferase family 4 protein [Pyrinomonadaceae bacterium]MDW8303417.1 glycosyltransferase family 4 protein [Acidobacteriota bacterium]